MKETNLEIGGTCRLVRTDFDGGLPSDVTLDYTESSSDPWFSDTENSLDIDKKKAADIIEFLKAAYNL